MRRTRIGVGNEHCQEVEIERRQGFFLAWLHVRNVSAACEPVLVEDAPGPHRSVMAL